MTKLTFPTILSPPTPFPAVTYCLQCMNAFQSAAESLSEEEHLQIRKVDRETHFIQLFAFTPGCNWLDVVEVRFRPGSGTCLIREVSSFQRVVCTGF